MTSGGRFILCWLFIIYRIRTTTIQSDSLILVRSRTGRTFLSEVPPTFSEHVGGLHACPGRFYAILTIKIVLATLIRNCDIKVKGPRPAYNVIGNEVRSQPVPVVFSKRPLI